MQGLYGEVGSFYDDLIHTPLSREIDYSKAPNPPLFPGKTVPHLVSLLSTHMSHHNESITSVEVPNDIQNVLDAAAPLPNNVKRAAESQNPRDLMMDFCADGGNLRRGYVQNLQDLCSYWEKCAKFLLQQIATLNSSWTAHMNKAKFLHTKLQGDIVEALDGRERAIEQVKAVNHSVDHWKAVSLDRLSHLNEVQAQLTAVKNEYTVLEKKKVVVPVALPEKKVSPVPQEPKVITIVEKADHSKCEQALASVQAELEESKVALDDLKLQYDRLQDRYDRQAMMLAHQHTKAQEYRDQALAVSDEAKQKNFGDHRKKGRLQNHDPRPCRVA